MQKVLGSISAKTGTAPVRATALAVAAKVKEGKIISSPGPTAADNYPRCNAEVPEFTAMQFKPSI